MKRNYYIFSSGKLIRKQNTLYFEPGAASEPEEVELLVNEDQDEIEVMDDSVTNEENDSAEEFEPKKLPRRPIPVEDVEAIYCFSEMRFNTRFLNFVAQKQITLHLFNYYGYYTGSFYPREPFISGKLLLNQVNNYNDENKRVEIARKFVSGAADNILKNLLYHNARDKDMSVFIEKISILINKVTDTRDVNELMGIERNIRSLYYASWNLIISEEINFKKREKHPQTNPINALISFGNSLVYTSVLSEIYKTQLNPLISFLHQPGERRFSLALDIAEIFKPLLTDRIIFSLFNKGSYRRNILPKN